VKPQLYAICVKGLAYSTTRRQELTLAQLWSPQKRGDSGIKTWENTLAREMVSMDLSKRLRYVPLMAAGVVVFLGLVFLGGLTGLLWHIRTFDWGVKLTRSVLGPTADWVVWVVCFLLTLSPAVVAFVRRRVTPEIVVVLTSMFFPSLSLITTAFSYSVGTMLLVAASMLSGRWLDLCFYTGMDAGGTATTECPP
jgi:hypothetical protein